MEIRDVIHGSIGVEAIERPIIDSRYFQRLRQIKQLGFSEYSYPSATHNRYIHSLGAMQTATQAYENIFSAPSTFSKPLGINLAKKQPEVFARFRAVVRLGALLHDVGHGPLSHTSEFAMPKVETLKVPGNRPIEDRKATHEDYTLKIILDSDMTPAIEKAGQAYGFTPLHVASLIDSTLSVPDSFFTETILGEKINFRPILQQLISSELDADRMDYLRRDSFQAGVSYGQFDFEWLVSNLTSYIHKGKCYLALQHRALYAFEDFLISRYHMFMMVYFHYKSIVFDEMLAKYFESPDCDYAIPSDMEAYSEYIDSHLYAHLARSKNPWAKRITEKNPFKMLVELHSGIPATRTAVVEQERLLEKIETDLKSQGIYYLITRATGELSKYFRKPGAPIYVRYDNHFSAPAYIPLQQCTDLYQRFGEKRSITRLYVSPEDYPKYRNTGRNEPLPYEDFPSTFENPAGN